MNKIVELTSRQETAISLLEIALEQCAREKVYFAPDSSRGFIIACNGDTLFGGVSESFCCCNEDEENYEELVDSNIRLQYIEIGHDIFSEDFGEYPELVVPDGFKVKYNVYQKEAGDKTPINIHTKDLYVSYDTIGQVVDHFKRIKNQEEYKKWEFTPEHVGSTLASLGSRAWSNVTRKDGSKFRIEVHVSLEKTEDAQ